MVDLSYLKLLIVIVSDKNTLTVCVKFMLWGIVRMRFSTMINQLKRICDSLDAMQSVGKVYYSQSMEQLDEIANLANRVAGYAQKVQTNSIVGETNIKRSKVESSDVTESGLSEQTINQLQPVIEALQVMLNQKPSETTVTTATKYDISHRPISQIPTVITDSNISVTQGTYEDTKYSVNDNLSPDDMNEIRKMPTKAKAAMCRQITSVYHTKLLQISKRVSEYECLNQLSKLIWDWYSVRIIKNRQYNCQFRYSVRRIKNIIYSIIIAYGYHLEQGDVNNFVLSFYDWLKLVGSDSTVTDKYASPYEVYDIEINHTCIYANVTAMVLSDLLWDFGFSEIRSATTSASFVYFSPHGVAMLTEELSPTVAEKYRDYRADPDVLTEVGIA